jgi:hypothetical protein
MRACKLTCNITMKSVSVSSMVSLVSPAALRERLVGVYVYFEKRLDSRNAAATKSKDGAEVGIPCQPARSPLTETEMPSVARRIVQNSPLGMGDGERH